MLHTKLKNQPMKKKSNKKYIEFLYMLMWQKKFIFQFENR